MVTKSTISRRRRAKPNTRRARTKERVQTIYRVVSEDTSLSLVIDMDARKLELIVVVVCLYCFGVSCVAVGFFLHFLGAMENSVVGSARVFGFTKTGSSIYYLSLAYWANDHAARASVDRRGREGIMLPSVLPSGELVVLSEK